MATSDIEKALTAFPISGATKGGMTMRTRISGLLLGLVLTINAYGQPPSASTSDGSPS
jgi:hypothetical protein